MSALTEFRSQEKFADPDRTADGSERARVALRALQTLWINTGSLCNIECANCYIESSPTNDRLVYLTAAEVAAYLDEIDKLSLPTSEIGFTGGEPFMNPAFLPMLDDALARGFSALVLTNAMQPMMRLPIRKGLIGLRERYGAKLTLRVSLDHFTARLHDLERGDGSFDKAAAGMDWLSAEGFDVTIAARSRWAETEDQTRAGFATLIAGRGWPIDAQDPAQLVIFPEMDETAEVPEITTGCWEILGKSPDEVMCASSRMVVKRKGATQPTVLPCTLLPYDRAFEMGSTLAEAADADGAMFESGAVKLCHPHCAKFCVLGGASCS
ncbi:Antilisterial bacteriocin subtilosin biosynthesis protein AlbA [Methyloligella halotolerans]|uniref:Antilisterial bacteriocin subtilosin biosynthesis protein AlbA n=1 Tax=Methyloligella halotolerans TaxID=1177755 RepID=A0A1E2RXV2_9HYPH|nr:radical SAM protein [Methyloligella halotolerans]ODA67054.1 Antilisterial bacteriocin subtilosin biosynthesis protein AlbA [Methyloligella halotolerans]